MRRRAWAVLALVVVAAFATSCQSAGGGQPRVQEPSPEELLLAALTKATKDYNALRVEVQTAAADGDLGEAAKAELDDAGRATETALNDAAEALDDWLAAPTESNKATADQAFAVLKATLGDLRAKWRLHRPGARNG